jgi:hypothetical protein
MAARLAMLAFAALSLAACETASTDDTAVHRGASPTLGDLGHHQRGMVRGPVVADAAPARAAHATAHHAAAHPAVVRATAARSTGTRTASVVPNPMRSPHTATTAPATVPATTATAAAAQPSALPTEPAQPASITAQQAVETPAAPAATASEAQSTIGAYPAGSDDASTVPVSDQPVQPTPPIEFSIGDLTPDKISAMFGGMPFLLIASIAAALVASLGLALRSSKPDKEQEPEYNGPRVVDYDEDHREPYAA